MLITHLLLVVEVWDNKPTTTTAARFTKFAGYFHWGFGVSFSGKENSLILKNKMAATGISLKIIDIFLLAVSHR